MGVRVLTRCSQSGRRRCSSDFPSWRRGGRGAGDHGELKCVIVKVVRVLHHHRGTAGVNGMMARSWAWTGSSDTEGKRGYALIRG
jgi:hypothetical protein